MTSSKAATSPPARSVTHATFVLERTYDAAPARVFAAFASKEAKARWFGEPDGWSTSRWDLDFRAGGRERNVAAPEGGGPDHVFDARYLDIVDGERIIYSYEMTVGGAKLSVSMTTIEFHAAGDGRGTRLVFTEHGAFLDGHEDPRLREEGTRGILELLAAALR